MVRDLTREILDNVKLTNRLYALMCAETFLASTCFGIKHYNDIRKTRLGCGG